MSNEFIINIFTQLVSIIQTQLVLTEDKKHQFRLIQIRKAINILRKMPEIDNLSKIQNISGFGDGIKKRIREILNTGSLSELYNNNPETSIISVLMKIHGIGVAKAKSLYLEHNIKSLEDLRLNTNLLSPASKIALKYYDHLIQPIPRDAITSIKNYIQRIFPDLNFTVCGSYRRGNKFSGDIDILVVNYSLKQIIKVLTEKGFIVGHLTATNSSKFMGICCCPRGPKYCRIDFMLTSENTFPYALMHFTGSDTFNRAIRYHALKLGLKLTENGIESQYEHVKLDLSNIKTERDICEYLNYGYVEPEFR